MGESVSEMHMDIGIRFDLQLHHLVQSDFMSLSLSFLNCELYTITVPPSQP